ncbi:MAG: hypothetical protein CMJ32_06770 [Phycisphaerae bacterium]|nr:hypothetical protein [Phycisphaerae bacterium]
MGCGTSTSDRDLHYVTAVEAEQLLVQPKGLFGLGGKTEGIWLDPRSKEAYELGHIPGAINIPFPDIAPLHKIKLPGNPLVIVYGDDYDDILAIAASKRLMELKYSDIKTLRGGLRQWKKDGNRIVTGPEPGGKEKDEG